MRTTLILLGTLLGFSACVSTFYYRPSASQPGQMDAVYTKGLPGLRSQQFGADLTAGLSARGEKDLELLIYLYNDGDSAYTFDPKEVKASGYDAFGQMKPLRVFGAEEYIRWKNTRDILIGSAIVIGAVVAIVAISEATDHKSHGSGGGNNAAARHSNYSTTLDWIDFSVNTSYLLAGALRPPTRVPEMPEDGLLREHTVYPGEAIQGVVKIRGSEPFLHRILVEVPVKGAYHKFVFENRTRVR